MAYQEVSLYELREKLGIESTSRGYANCPFCGDTGKKLKFTDNKNQWRCNKCKAHGGVLHLFAMYQLGMDSLPSDKAARSKISEQLREFMGYTDPGYIRQPKRQAPAPKEPERPIAPDAQLHAVYSAMANLPLFQLQYEHKKDLLRRGLTNAQIEANGYRTFPYKANIPQRIQELYCSTDPALRSGLNPKQASHIMLGLFAAQLLLEQGYRLEGIPGFYKFGNHWCLTYDPGLLIPTRNIHGQIVVWQVRKYYGEAKYKTLSCGGKPGSVDGSVSRAHFPISNAKPSPEIQVIFTEGPLKADIASALYRDPCMFIAIPGISNTARLLSNCQTLKDQYGIRQIFNALDMDRYTNPNVIEGSAELTGALQAMGMQVIPMCWGENHAVDQLMIYQAIAHLRGVKIPPHDYRLSVYDKLSITSLALNAVGIKPGRQNESSQYWENKTKGIDDFLLSMQPEKESKEKKKAVGFHQAYYDAIRQVNSDRK